MADDVSGAGAQPLEVGLLILRGQPADDELAALVTVLAVIAARVPQAVGEQQRPQAAVRRRRRSPGSWRSGARTN
jgi:hypothetical protein